MAHTPGTWTIHPTKTQIVGGEGGMTSIANVFGTHWRHAATRATDPNMAREFQEMAHEHDANARLIAAAPDLLASLVTLLPMAVADVEEYGGDPDTDARIIAARAVIAKATVEI